jgi:hypothetical protein
MFYNHVRYDLNLNELNPLSRAHAVCTNIADYFLQFISPDSIIYIIDPYLNPDKEIIEPLSNSIYDENVWSFFIAFLIDYIPNGKIKILTGFDLKGLKLKLNLDFEDAPIKINHNFNSNCEIFISALFKGGNKSPDELHDRVVLLEGETNRGFHIGPSLTNIERIDCTLTKFSDENITDCIERIKQVWNLSLNIRK